MCPQTFDQPTPSPIPDGTHALFGQSSIQMLGMARQFDFTVSLCESDAYRRIAAGEPKILQTYAHEWTHYFQFLGTSLGSLAAELEFACFLLKWNLLNQIGTARVETFIPPALDMLRRSKQLLSQPGVRKAADVLALCCQARAALYSTWTIEEAPIDLTLDEIRGRRPFLLDRTRQALIYKGRDGSTTELRISLRQILEHAAKCNEVTVAGGIFRRDLLRKDLLDYHGLLLYLYQEGIISILTNGDIFMVTLAGWQGAEAVLMTLATMFTACQVALMLYLLPQFHRRYDESSLGDQHSRQNVEFADGCMASSAHVLCVLVSQLQKVAEHVAMAVNTPRESPLQPLDELCSILQLPSYTEALRQQTARAEKAVKQAIEHGPFSRRVLDELKDTPDLSADQICFLESMPPHYTELFFGRAAITFNTLLHDAKTSVSPLFNCDEVPLPYILVDTAEGVHRMCIRFPWQSDVKVMQIPASLESSFSEMYMIADKLLLDSDLACYRHRGELEPVPVTRASSYCRDFDACIRRKKTTLIDFCSHDLWRRKAKQSLSNFGLSHSG